MGKLGETIGAASIGCSVQIHKFMNIDMCESAHGRAPAVASGIKRVHPDKLVFTYQGDGDLASIGMGEIVHAAARGEKICTFFINNCVYGMTSGQMAPTTLIGQKTTTSQAGRTKEQAGMPIRMAELLSTLDGCVYAERVCVTDIANINKAKRAIKKAFEKQMNREGFTFIEVLSTCPTNWGMTPLKAVDWLKENMIPYYPLGVIKDVQSEAAEVK
jgi:2-oxoglutarate ferredoxin oxidoreductase subunit beta